MSATQTETTTTDDLAHLRATLTAEEIAAMDAELSEDEVTSLKAVADAAKTGDDDEDDDDPAGGEAGAAGAAAGAGATAAEAAASAAEAQAEAAATAAAAAPAAPAAAPAPAADDFNPGNQFTPRAYEAKLPADFEARSEKLKTETESLNARMESGEINFKEFTVENSRLSGEREELNSLRIKADISQDQTRQSQTDAWHNTVNGFFDHAKKLGVDYRTDAARAGDLDTFVKVLAQNPANEDKPMHWFLNEAHRRVKALHGDVAAPTPAPAAAAAPTAAPAAATQAPKPPTRKAPIDSAPTTLAHVPGGEGPGDVADEFADLDALDGEQLESALRKMSPDARSRYLAGA